MDQLGSTIFGEAEWDFAKRWVWITALIFTLASLLYGLDLIVRPFVRLGRQLYIFWAWGRGLQPSEGDIPVLTIQDAEWRGPTAAKPTDNDFYRDPVRARSAQKRKPNHLLIEIGGKLARLTRPSFKLRNVTRHVQTWDITEILSATDN